MGMFDTIKYKESEYQTKDLGSFLDEYRIEDRVLIKENYEYKKEGSVSRIGFPVLKKVPLGDSKINFHGIIRIYNREEEVWLKFTDGKLVSEMTELEYLKSLTSED